MNIFDFIILIIGIFCIITVFMLWSALKISSESNNNTTSNKRINKEIAYNSSNACEINMNCAGDFTTTINISTKYKIGDIVYYVYSLTDCIHTFDRCEIINIYIDSAHQLAHYNLKFLDRDAQFITQTIRADRAEARCLFDTANSAEKACKKFNLSFKKL